jgi:hypothetical protein
MRTCWSQKLIAIQQSAAGIFITLEAYQYFLFLQQVNYKMLIHKAAQCK